MTQEDKELEIWKPIPNYEEYEVSTFGRVKRLAYYKPVCGGSFQHCNERILSPQLRKNGYQTVMLSKKGVVKSFLIHRLVAITFIPNYKTCGNYQWKYSNKEVFTGLPDKLEKQLKDDEVGLSYDGYMYSYPDSFIKKKSAYIALCDSLRQCEEFIDDIKLLL